MAFAYTVDKVLTGLNGRVVIGTYTNTGGSTGGDVSTGLTNTYSFIPVAKGAAVTANAPAPNETFPLSGDTVTIVTAANEVGTFTAFGE